MITLEDIKYYVVDFLNNYNIETTEDFIPIPVY